MPRKKPGLPVIDNIPIQKPQNPDKRWVFFDAEIAKVNNKKTGTRELFKKILRWVLAIPKFVIDWFEVYEPRWRTTLALIILAAIISTLFFASSKFSEAASFTFFQTDWSGGADSSNASHPGNQSGWTKFSAQTNADTSTAGTVKAGSYTNSFTDNFTTTTNKDAANTTATWDGSGQLSNPTFSNIAFRNGTHAAGSSATCNPGEPAGTASGDVLIALVIADARSSAPSLPTGWTSLYSGGTPQSNAAGFSYAVDYIVRGGSAASTAFTLSSGYNNECFIIGFSGVSNSSPIDAQSANGATGTDSGGGHNPDPPAVVAVSNRAMAVAGGAFWGTGSGSSGWSAPANYTLRSNNAAGNTGMLASRLLSASGSENPPAFSGASTPGVSIDYWEGFTITLNPAAPSSVTAQSLTVDTTTNNIRAATLTKNDTPGSGTVTYYLTNNGSSFSQVTPGSQFVFSSMASDLRFKIVLTGNATVQNISISYTGFQTSSDLTSSPYNTSDSRNIISKVAWSTTGTSGSLIVKLQVRSAPNNSGAPGTWSAWCGYMDCSGTTYFNSTDNNVTLSSSHPLRNGNDDQWFQYKVFFTTDGSATPTFDDITISYVVNAAPDFNPNYPSAAAGGVSASQDTNSASSTFGKVLINYSVRDTDTLSGTANPGFITPSFEYNIGGGWLAITSGNLGASDLTNKAVDGTNYTVYTATWNAQAQIPANYLTTAQVRVTANDNEGANNIAQAVSANFTLDTKAPAVSAFTIDGTQSKLTLTATDDTNLQYRFSNNSDLSADGLNASSGQWQTVGGNSINVNPTWNFTGAPSYTSAYLQIRDTAGNLTSATAKAPSTPGHMYIKDVSDMAATNYREFISWDVYTSAAGATFSKYEIFRSTNGSSYSSLASITNINTNYYVDAGLTLGTTYYYKVRIVDTDTDSGNFGSVVSDTANGNGGTDNTPPVITAITVAETQSTYAKITWTTDELSDSRVDFSIAPSTAFGSTQSIPSFVLSHSVTLTGLTPGTNYLFRVKSADIFSNLATDDNTGAGYSFTTIAGPKISNVTETTITDKTAQIFWNTNTNSDSFVTYSTSASLSSPTRVGSATLVGGSGTFQHIVNLTGLTAGTTYYFFVESTDASSNYTKDTNGNNYYNFRTTADTKPPVITNISTPVLAPTAGVIVWQTDEPSTTQADYGTVSGTYTTTTTLDTTLTIFHIVSLNNLAENTRYYFDVRSKDAAGNEAVSPESNLVTGVTTIVQVVGGGGGGGGTNYPAPDTTPPQISNVKVANTAAFGATITFNTDEDSVGFVNYGTADGQFTLTAGSANYAQAQSIKLDGLKMGTNYFFQVKAVDKGGNISTSDSGKFKTLYFSDATPTLANVAQFQQEVENAIESALPSLAPPFIEKPQISEVTDNSAKVTWRSNIKTYSVVGYATEDEYNSAKDPNNPYTVEVSDTANKVLSHELVLQGLRPNTVYHYRAKGFSLPQLVGQSGDFTFVTKALDIKAAITDIGNSSLKVIWHTDEPTSSIVQYRDTKTGALSQKIINEQATSHEILVDNLTPGTAYEVSVFGFNSKGNKVQTTAAARVTTSQDVTPPQILSLKIDTAIIPGQTDRAQTIVSWKTDEPSTSIVYFEESATSIEGKKELANKVEITNSFVLDHAVVLTTLKPGGLYRIQVGSKDAAGNLNLLPVKTIVIPRQSESILDVIFKNFEDAFKFLRQIK